MIQFCAGITGEVGLILGRIRDIMLQDSPFLIILSLLISCHATSEVDLTSNISTVNLEFV
jgi:F0F1-type ATP synthase assembly protein I